MQNLFLLKKNYANSFRFSLALVGILSARTGKSCVFVKSISVLCWERNLCLKLGSFFLDLFFISIVIFQKYNSKKISLFIFSWFSFNMLSFFCIFLLCHKFSQQNNISVWILVLKNSQVNIIKNSYKIFIYNINDARKYADINEKL